MRKVHLALFFLMVPSVPTEILMVPLDLMVPGLMVPAVLTETLDLDSFFSKVPVVCCSAASNPKIRK